MASRRWTLSPLIIMSGVPGYLCCRRGSCICSAAAGSAPLLVPTAAVTVYAVYAFKKGQQLVSAVLIFTAPVAFIYLLVVFGLWRRARGTV
jgi:hypothetical protein